jgi:hypothetical protein
MPSSRAQAFFRGNEGSTHWQAQNALAAEPVDPKTYTVPPMNPVPGAANRPMPTVAPAVVQSTVATKPNPVQPAVANTPAQAIPVQQQQVTPTAYTPKPVATTPAPKLPYTLMSWQWTEKIRTAAGTEAKNLVALINAKGDVKVRFDCPNPIEAKAIAGRIAAIPEFHKLEIDFEINATK